MIVAKNNQKTFGVLHSENYFSFIGFCKKVNSDEIQKVDIYLDDELIDIILADKHLEKLENIYDIEGFGFEYILPNKYVGAKKIINFKNHETKEDLQNSPYKLLSINDLKFNEMAFLNSLKDPLIIEQLKDIYSPNSIGFLVTEDNIQNEVLFEYIQILSIEFPNISFKGFYYDFKLAESVPTKFNTNVKFFYCANVLQIAELVALFFYSGNLTKKFNFIERETYKTLIYYSKNIACLDINIPTRSSSIQDIDLIYKDNFIITKHKEFGISKDTLKKYNSSYTRLFYEYLCEINRFTELLNINKESNAYCFYFSKRITILLENTEFKNKYIHQFRKQFTFYYPINNKS